MSYLKIGDNEYTVPEDYALKDWMEIARMLNVDQYISTALGVPMDEVLLLNDEMKELAFAFVHSVVYPEVSVNTSIREGKLIDFESITLGSFIDLEVIGVTGLHRSIDKMANLLYQVEDSFTIREVWGAVKMFLEWKNALYQSYSALFRTDGKKEVTDTSVHTSAKQWMNLVMVLAQGDVLKMDEVTKLPVKQAFNWLAWNKEQQLKQRNEQERQNLQRRVTKR